MSHVQNGAAPPSDKGLHSHGINKYHARSQVLLAQSHRGSDEDRARCAAPIGTTTVRPSGLSISSPPGNLHHECLVKHSGVLSCSVLLFVLTRVSQVNISVRIFGFPRRNWSTPCHFSAEVPLRCRCKALISSLTHFQIGFPAACIVCTAVQCMQVAIFSLP